MTIRLENTKKLLILSDECNLAKQKCIMVVIEQISEKIINLIPYLMKTKTIIANVALALTLSVFYSCEKKAEDLLDTDTSSAKDNSTADNAASEMFKSVSENADNDASLRTTPCYTVTVSAGLTFPKTMTIDFGSGGCGDKRGQIIAVLSGRFRTAGSTITITTNNFYIGLNKIEAGTHVITNMGNNINNKQTFDVSITGASVISPSGTASWNATRTLIWEEGDTTPTDPTDDVYSISGQTNGTSTAGVTYTSSTTAGKPLVVKVGCQYVSSGEVSLTPNGKPVRTINFGAATTPAVCGDNQATVTIGSGAPINITL